MAKYIEFRGKKVFFRTAGNGPAIVFIHGFLESSGIWKNYIRKLSSQYRVIAPDLPGHGLSDSIASVHSMDLMAEAVNRILIEQQVKSCLLVGHSMGGYVALAMAGRYSRKLKGLVLFHSHAAADSTEARDNRDRTIALVKKDHHGFIKNFIPDLFSPENREKYSPEMAVLREMASNTSKEGIIAALEGMKTRPDRTHILTQLEVPALFIIGKNDSRIPMPVILPQAILPAQSEIVVLDHVGHMGFIEASSATYAAVKGFADRL
jgi:pimeloyl-ACP methyl ester carboxylesterase